MEEDMDWELPWDWNEKDMGRELRRVWNEKDMDMELRRHLNGVPYKDPEQWSPWDDGDLPQEKDIIKQPQNHLNHSSSSESHLFLGEEILRPYVKKLRTKRLRYSVLPKFVNHCDASVNGDVPGERNTASNWTARTYFSVHIRETKTETAYDDGYRWKKYWQKDIVGSKYPREFFRCEHQKSEGCPARKQVQRLDEDPTLFKVIHLRRHTCKQFSHLYTGRSLITTEEDSDYTVFSRNIEAALMWTIARLDGYSWRKIAQSEVLGFKFPTISAYFHCPHSESKGCLARKCVERSDKGRTIFRVTHLGKHTCKAEPTEAASNDEVWREIVTELLWTARVADGYSWSKDWQEDIPFSKIHPRVYYRCIDHLSQGCLATKHILIPDRDPSFFEVTYRGRHTCKQSSHLATDAAVEPTKAASDDKDVSRNTNTAPKWTATTYVDGYSWQKYDQKAAAGSKYIREFFRCTHCSSKGCPALKRVRRSDNGGTLFEVTYWGRHTCEQSSHLATTAAVEPTKGASQEKDISKQLQNHLNPSSTTDAQLLSGEEILCSPLKELPIGNSDILSETLIHSATSDDRDVPRKRNSAPKWTATTYVDRYIWIKCGQKAVPGSKYQREYFGCIHSISQGCLATKQVQRSDKDPTLFEVTYGGERHKCKQSSHLATAAAVQPTEAASGDKDVSRNIETALMWSVAHLDGYSWGKYAEKNILGSKYPREHYRCTHRDSQGCLATKRAQRLNDDPSIFEVTYRRRHTCDQSSLHLPQPIQAESEVKPEKSEISFTRILLVANLVLELSSAVFDQFSSVHKPHYAMILMLLSFAALVPCIVKLVYRGKKKRVIGTRGNNNRNSFSNVAEIVGFTCAICQSILTTANYVLLIQHTKIQIHISLWPIIFAFVLLWVEFSDKTDKSDGERSSNTEV